MLRIRLSRKGKKRQPSYRVVVADQKFKRDGRFVENIGWYNPLTDPESYMIKEDRALYWLSVGAQPSDPVKRLLKNQGTLDRLPRVHQGESIEALVAEFQGVSLEEGEAAEEETVAEAAAEEKAEEEIEEESEEVAVAEAEETAEEVVEAEAEEAEEAGEAEAEEAEAAEEADKEAEEAELDEETEEEVEEETEVEEAEEASEEEEEA